MCRRARKSRRAYALASAEVKIERDLLAVLGTQRTEDEGLILGVHRQNDALASLGGGAKRGLQRCESSDASGRRCAAHLTEMEVEIELGVVNLARLNLESFAA